MDEEFALAANLAIGSRSIQLSWKVIDINFEMLFYFLISYFALTVGLKVKCC